MSREEDIQHLKTLKSQHERNIRALEEMLASYGLERPIHLLNSLTFEQETLQTLQNRLDAIEGKPGAEQNAVPPVNLPRRTYFVGREREIEVILESLSPASRTFIVALEGLGGVGKSSLAVEIGYRCLERGDMTAVIWVSAKEALLTAQGIEEYEPELKALQDIFVTIGMVLNYPAIGTAPLAEQQRIAFELLAKQTTLLIIDNVETLPATEREQIVAFLRKTPVTVKALITSRERIVEGHTVRLQGLPPDDSLRLIEWNAQQRDVRLTQQQIQQIIELTGGLPLAMIWIQSQIAMFGRSANQMLEQLARDPNLPLLRFCFNRSWHMLSELEAQHLLIALSLHVTSAGRAALRMISDVNDSNRVDPALSELLQLSLVLYDQEQDRFDMLQLTRTFVRSQAKDFRAFVQKSEARMAQYYLQLVSQQSGYQQWREYDQLLLDRDNILRVVQWLHKEVRRSHTQRAKPSRKAVKLAETLTALVRSFGSVLWQRGYWYDRLTLTHAAIEAAEILEDASAIGTFRRNIAWIYYYQSDNVRAKQWARLSLDAVLLTHDRLLIAAAKRALGTIEIRLHSFDIAEQLLTEALDSYQEDPTNDYELYNRGFAQQGFGDLAYERGDYQAARQWYERALETWHTPGRQDPVRHTPYSLNGLGLVALQCGDINGAAGWFEQSIRAAEEFGRAEERARARFGLARVAAARGAAVQARTIAEEALEVFRTMGMQHEIRQSQEFIDSLDAIGGNEKR